MLYEYDIFLNSSEAQDWLFFFQSTGFIFISGSLSLVKLEDLKESGYPKKDLSVTVDFGTGETFEYKTTEQEKGK